MTYYLAREMGQLQQVKWVGVRPRPRMEPDCELCFDILTFSTRWRQVVAEGPGQAEFVLNVGMQIQVNLYYHRLKTVVYGRSEEYNYDFPLEMDDATRPGLQFDKYYQRVARNVVESVEAFLSQ